MENKNTERISMPTEFTLSPEDDGIRVKFFEKNAGVDLSSDFTLPDYLPEIRKMLGVSAKISPLSRYIGNDIEFSGRVDYDLIYCSGEGELTSVPLGEDFSFSVTADIPTSIDKSGEIDAFADIQTDMLHVRVTAPRKLNVKCRLHSLVSFYGYDENGRRNGSIRNAERLVSKGMNSTLHRTMSELVELSDEILLDPQSTRPIISRESTVINEASIEGTRLNCRGEVVASILMEDQNTGKFDTVIKKIPFTHEAELPAGAKGEIEAHSVKGMGGEIKLTESEGKYLLDTEVILEIDTIHSHPVSFTEDIFIPNEDCSITYRDIKYTALHKDGRGNLTISESFPLSELSLSRECEIIDKNCTVRIDGLGKNEDGNLINGNIKLWILSKNDDEYSSGEVTIPFSMETGIKECSKKLNLMAKPSIKAIRCTIEGERAVCEADICIFYCVLREESARIAESVTAIQKNEKTAPGITVYYPQKGETLWSVSKKFGVSPSSVAENNSIPSKDPNEDISFKHFITIF